MLEIRGFQLPENVYVEEETFSDRYCKLIAEPLERGYGVTIGNVLRRILLSSIEGAAITSVRIENVYHEFSTVKGVKEDVSEIVLNLKRIRLRLAGDEELVAHIDVTDKDQVTAADIQADSRLVILNPDAQIAMLDRGVDFKAELRINKGRGYIPSEEIPTENLPIGTISVDAIFTPVTKVLFSVDKTRVGKSTDYDKLILEVWTDGSINPKDAVGKATQILQRHLKYFMLAGDEKPGEEIVVKEKAGVAYKEAETHYVAPVHVAPPGNKEFNKNLIRTVDELEFSVRSQNCLKNADIKYIYELVQRSEHEMLKMKNFGRKSLDEIREILLTMGLDFNVRVDMDAVKRELAAKNGG